MNTGKVCKGDMSRLQGMAPQRSDGYGELNSSNRDQDD